MQASPGLSRACRPSSARHRPLAIHHLFASHKTFHRGRILIVLSVIGVRSFHLEYGFNRIPFTGGLYTHPGFELYLGVTAS